MKKSTIALLIITSSVFGYYISRKVALNAFNGDLSSIVTGKKKKKKQRKKKPQRERKFLDISTAQIIQTLKAPPLLPKKFLRWYASNSSSNDGSFFTENQKDAIIITDTKNNAIVRLYKIVRQEAPTLILSKQTETEIPAKKLLKAIKKPLKYTARVHAWFNQPREELKKRQRFEKQLFSFSGIHEHQIDDLARKLTDEELTTVIGHTFAKEVDKHLETLGAYILHEEKGKSVDGIYLLGEMEYEGIIHPLVFGYAFSKTKTNLIVNYHRFADPKSGFPQLEKLMMLGSQKLKPHIFQRTSQTSQTGSKSTASTSKLPTTG